MLSKRLAYAFTLAELLVAIAITLLIISVLFRVFAAATSQWQSADQRIDTFRDARAALQLLARDIGRADVNGVPQMLTLSDFFSPPLPSTKFAKEAFAITPIPNTGKSDLCIVGYYGWYDGTTKAYSLKRIFKNSDYTYTFLSSPSPSPSPNYSPSATPGVYAKDTPAPDEIVAAYVWDLQLRPGIGADFVDPETTASTTWKWMEIRFKSMSPAAGRKIRHTAVDYPTWFDATSSLYKTFILPYEQQFVTRVVLNQNQ